MLQDFLIWLLGSEVLNFVGALLFALMVTLMLTASLSALVGGTGRLRHFRTDIVDEKQNSRHITK